ncbi:MAG: pseudouridine synthase [Verrucomicrobiota bacterium]
MEFLVNAAPPCVLFEDDHLLVVNKPAGMNTHAPSPFSGEGLYDWLRHREPRWASLAILHRLDKDTSGVMLFGKSDLANHSLTQQFTAHTLHKQYILETDHAVRPDTFTVTSALVRAGDKYVSRPVFPGGDTAETRFTVLSREGNRTVVRAEPITGRTHQIRVHAADRGFPILGDTRYGGTPAARVYLHAAQISLTHPGTNQPVTFKAEPHFSAHPNLALRRAVITPEATNAFRLLHGAADGWPGWYVDRLGNYLLSQSEQPLSDRQQAELWRLGESFAVPSQEAILGTYHKILSREIRHLRAEDASPRLCAGTTAPERFGIRENGVQFELSMGEGYSVGLFLDQRDNRRRLLSGHVAAGIRLPQTGARLLNVFAYTCGFSVCAALGGFATTSLDLSKKYLDWGRRNFSLNGLDPAQHDFIFGDAFDWLKRLAKKGRKFDVIVLDPPTFSQSRERGVFRAEKDYGRLAEAALPLLLPGGILLASTNAAGLEPERFLEMLQGGVQRSGRDWVASHYVPQPPDFPVTRQEPAYLKTVWVKVG